MKWDYGYIHPPKPVQDLISKWQQAKEILTLQGKSIRPLAEWIWSKLGMEYRNFGTELDPIWRWVKVKAFKGNSSKQVLAYLRYKQRTAKTKLEASKYIPPLTVKTKKETTGKDDLQRIADSTGDPVLTKIMEIRSLSTNLNNYIPNWKPGSDGRVHSTFKYTAASGQLNSILPNVLNCSAHTPLGQKFRRIIEAPSGYKIVEFDYDRFHVIMLGFEAEDRDYIRFGRLDCHSIFTSQVVNDAVIDMSMSDGEIKERVAYIKKKYRLIRDYQVKKVVLGNQLGLGHMKLYHNNRPSLVDGQWVGIESPKQALYLQERLAERYPVAHKYRHKITIQAQKQEYLLNNWGIRQEFFEVLVPRWDKQTNGWKKVICNQCSYEGMPHGTQYEQALAFPVQSDSFGMMKHVERVMEDRGLLEKYGFVVPVHDSHVFITNHVGNCIADVYPILTAPESYLTNAACPGGLQVGVGVEVGQNWAKATGDNPNGMREIDVGAIGRL